MAHIYNSQLDAFELYHQLQESKTSSGSFFSAQGSALPALGHAIAGSTGAAVSNLCTYPLDLIITRLQIQRQLRKHRSTPSDAEYAGIEDAAWKIYSNEGGLVAFYTGVLQDTGKTIADSFFFFLTYNYLRQRRLAARGNGSSVKILPALEELMVGFLAGSFTKLLTTPIANVVTRKQASAMMSARSPLETPHKLPSTAELAQDIFHQRGLLGFWSGYSASLILTLNPSVTFFLFETFKRLLPQSRRDNPHPAATFLMAAVSKACASTVTYPFSLAKSRAQAGGMPAARSEEKIEDHDIKAASGWTLRGGSTERAAARTTIFGTLIKIAQTEGIRGLYEGLPLEIIKGFFSHGITMIVKQAMHKMVVQLYYVISIVFSRYLRVGFANPERLAQNARQQRYEYYDLARARVDERLSPRIEAASEAKKSVIELVDGMSGGVDEVKGTTMDRAYETAELVADYVEEETAEWRSLYGTGLARWFDEK